MYKLISKINPFLLCSDTSNSTVFNNHHSNAENSNQNQAQNSSLHATPRVNDQIDSNANANSSDNNLNSNMSVNPGNEFETNDKDKPKKVRKSEIIDKKENIVLNQVKKMNEDLLDDKKGSYNLKNKQSLSKIKSSFNQNAQKDKKPCEVIYKPETMDEKIQNQEHQFDDYENRINSQMKKNERLKKQIQRNYRIQDQLQLEHINELKNKASKMTQN